MSFKSDDFPDENNVAVLVPHLVGQLDIDCAIVVAVENNAIGAAFTQCELLSFPFIGITESEVCQ